MKLKAFNHFHVMLALELPSLFLSYVLGTWKYRGKSLWLITERIIARGFIMRLLTHDRNA